MTTLNETIQPAGDRADSKSRVLLRALGAAFPCTIPILAGFTFLGAAYGIYMHASGFGPGVSLLMSLVVFAGSMQFVAVGLLLGPFDPGSALALTLLLGARHLFYGLSMLEQYRIPGLRRFYLIFGMCDETFSVNCTVQVPPGVDKGWFMFFVTLLDQLYWIGGTLLGAVFGGLFSFNTQGLEFVMTALFVVLLLEQLLGDQSRRSALIGLGVSALALLGFGAGGFILPAMGGILGALSLDRALAQKKGGPTP